MGRGDSILLHAIFTLARKIRNIVKWVWLFIGISLFITFFANLLVVKYEDLKKIVISDIISWLILPQLPSLLTLIVITTFLAISILSFLFGIFEDPFQGREEQQLYLKYVIEANKNLIPLSNISIPQQGLLSFSVSLTDVAIGLRFFPDKPVYDSPSMQEILLEGFRQNSNESIIEELVQGLKAIWQFQLGSYPNGNQQRQDVSINEVLQSLKPENPVAIILGSPGSGKSTTLRLLALQMAHLSLLRWWSHHSLPQALSSDGLNMALNKHFRHRFMRIFRPHFKRIPIFLHFSDYAKHYDAVQNASFQKFLTDYLTYTFPNLPHLSSRLLKQLAKGHCIVLIDGLNEIDNYYLRERLISSIETFISDYPSRDLKSRHYNLYILSSRSTNYDASKLAKYAHYTLRDLNNEEMTRILTNWCYVTEYYRFSLAQGTKIFTIQQESFITTRSEFQRDRLLLTLENNPSLKKLASNPLILTLLVLFDYSGLTLPYHRLEFYQFVISIMLNCWNREHKIFTEDKIFLAKNCLENLALDMELNNSVLSEEKVKRSIEQTTSGLYLASTTSTNEIYLVNGLRCHCELLIKTGQISAQNLYSFSYHAFQEYFLGLHLSKQNLAELTNFMKTNVNSEAWQEPLSLAIVYKSRQLSLLQKQEASKMVQSILDFQNDYDHHLHRNLFFATRILADCDVWSIDKSVQHRVANLLFDLYGAISEGHESELQRDIKKVAKLWLNRQPGENGQQLSTPFPPLLQAWCLALRINNPLRQKGAKDLLKAIEPDHPFLTVLPLDCSSGTSILEVFLRTNRYLDNFR